MQTTRWLMFVGLVVTLGCGRREVAPGVTVDKQGGQVTIKTKDGGVVVGGTVSLPKGFPADVPIYPGGKLESALTVQNAFQVTFTTSDPFAKVLSFYEEKMKGWKSVAQQNTAEGGTQIWQQEGRTVTLNAAPADGKTSVSLSVGQESKES